MLEIEDEATDTPTTGSSVSTPRVTGTQAPLKPFTTDGCSGFLSFNWRLLFGVAPPWEGCCLTHDRAYHQGGPVALRLKADTELMRCVAANGHPYWAIIMFIAVRLGGPRWLPFPSLRKQTDGRWKFSMNEVRWGYGWKFPRYKE